MAEQVRPESVVLPDGWLVRPNSCVGVEMVTDSGRIISQHPVDSVAWRQLVLWGWAHSTGIIEGGIGMKGKPQEERG